jgi:hypothetical protein
MNPFSRFDLNKNTLINNIIINAINNRFNIIKREAKI